MPCDLCIVSHADRISLVDSFSSANHPIAVVNRVGKEGRINFWGSSFVSGPFGEILARASADKEETLIVKCDLSRIDETRHGWPFLRDRRIDAYKGITSRFLD